jgi:23S rRNA (cytidine1920-2'-O)/16S rRNA (cytidine1409-2'-O)-methyltransferase
VIGCERTDVRDVTLETVGGVPVDLVTADLSFISLRRAVPALVGEAVGPGAPVIVLVKPQFEAGRTEASRGQGVIRDPRIHRRTLYEVAGALAAAGADIIGAMPSPITGAAGNIEFLLHARAPSAPVGDRSAAGPAGDEPPWAGQGPTADRTPMPASALLDQALAEAARPGPQG